jgi:hypothetical protein
VRNTASIRGVVAVWQLSFHDRAEFGQRAGVVAFWVYSWSWHFVCHWAFSRSGRVHPGLCHHHPAVAYGTASPGGAKVAIVTAGLEPGAAWHWGGALRGVHSCVLVREGAESCGPLPF